VCVYVCVCVCVCVCVLESERGGRRVRVKCVTRRVVMCDSEKREANAVMRVARSVIIHLQAVHWRTSPEVRTCPSKHPSCTRTHTHLPSLVLD